VCLVNTKTFDSAHPYKGVLCGWKVIVRHQDDRGVMWLAPCLCGSYNKYGWNYDNERGIGFHIFRYQKDAMSWADHSMEVVKPVYFRRSAVHGTGVQEGTTRPCILVSAFHFGRAPKKKGAKIT
jgi:hypothetical protein